VSDFVRFQVDSSKLLEVVRHIPRDELPYVTALAFHRLAKLIVGKGKQTLRQNFTIRSRWVLTSWAAFTPSGSSAETRGAIFELKRLWPDAFVIVGHRDEYMRLQETGGLKQPKQGDRFVPIPTRLTWAQRSRSGAIPRSLTHFALLRQQLARLATQPGAGQNVRVVESRRRELAAMLRRQRRELAKGELGMLFLRRPFARIAARAGLLAMAQREFEARAPDEFLRAWEAAMRTSRKGF